MKKNVIAAILASLILSGCVTGWQGPKPLSDRWASERRHEEEILERRARIGRQIIGERPAVVDEPRSRPLIGSHEGLGAEIRGLSGGSLRYRVRW